MNNKLMSAMITGSLLGATASMIVVSKMDPKQRKSMVKMNKRAMSNIMESMGMY